MHEIELLRKVFKERLLIDLNLFLVGPSLFAAVFNPAKSRRDPEHVLRFTIDASVKLQAGVAESWPR